MLLSANKQESDSFYTLTFHMKLSQAQWALENFNSSPFLQGTLIGHRLKGLPIPQPHPATMLRERGGLVVAGKGACDQDLVVLLLMNESQTESGKIDQNSVM